MSLLPVLLSAALWADLERPYMMDQNFGMGLRSDQLPGLSSLEKLYGNRLLNSLYYRPWTDILRATEGGLSAIKADKEGFKVFLDVQQFKPEELQVRVMDNTLLIEAKHEEKRDQHGLISRQFVRKYILPEGVDPEKISSSISTDGVLTISAPLRDQPQEKPGRIIEIERTGKPALRQEETPRSSMEGQDLTTEGTTITTEENEEANEATK
ncbi:protein lethal(2)essential for life [Orussus abietinus]|uniref:protein lethal(2)essential for life n=1 Tax=Orussus abietinus TaxID=222816 RepID=UPI0006254D08|nr:protein lethal(2)essential for life [Orussus abietinus]